MGFHVDDISMITLSVKAFKKLHDGLVKLAEDSESFESTITLGLLRSAPDLEVHLKDIKSRFTVDKGGDFCWRYYWLMYGGQRRMNFFRWRVKTKSTMA